MDARFAQRILREIWPALGGRIQENGWPMKWMPEHVVTESEADPESPGEKCGHYGCVAHTSDPTVMFKLTTDESEARVAHVLFSYLPQHENAQPHPNIIRYYGVYEVPGKSFDGRKIYAIWREECPCIGWKRWPKCLFEFATGLPQDGIICKRTRMQCRVAYRYEHNRAAKQAVEGLLDTASKLLMYRRSADRAWGYADFLRQTEFLQEGLWREQLYDQWQKAPEMLDRHKADPQFQVSEKRDQLSSYLANALYWTELLHETAFGGGVADLFDWCWHHGILLGDIHIDNVGVVYASREIAAAPRRFAVGRGTAYFPEMEPLLVVTDPGHALLMDPVYSDIKLEAL